MNERKIAELIFDKFRSSKCKAGEIVPMRVIRFSLIMNLNPKEKELFNIVFGGLQITGYFTYKKDPLECIVLTQKGYDYIYEENLVGKMQNTPWIIPACVDTDWNKAYNKLWRIIGSQEGALCYIKGSDFYNLILKCSDELPPSYGMYIDELRKKGRSTSRVDYYKDLIESLPKEQRMYFYGDLQSWIEDKLVYNRAEIEFEADLDLLEDKKTETESALAEKDVTDKQVETSMLEEQHPIVFISYSWDDEQHEAWVLNLATHLQSKYGIRVILDKWEMKLGKLLPHFMEHAITDSQRVICVMTPNYKKKTEKLVGGVGVEYSIISAEIQKDIKTEKFIPLFRSGNLEDIPVFLSGRDFIDMRDDANYEEKTEELARDIWNEPKCKKPALGSKPKFT